MCICVFRDANSLILSLHPPQGEHKSSPDPITKIGLALHLLILYELSILTV